MSNKLITEAYSRHLGTLTRKAVMVLLSDKASDDGSGIFASKQTMADELCASKQTIITAIKSLKDDGLLIEVGKRKNSNGYTVEYAIVPDALEALPLVGSAQRHQSRKLTGQGDGPVNDNDGTGQGDGPEPPLNLSPDDIANAISPPTPDEIVEAWNEVAADCGLPAVAKLTSERKRKLNCRIRDHPFDEWAAALAAIRRSRFLQGDNDRGWRANFDFLLQPSSFTKLIEGQYDGQQAQCRR